MVEQSIPSNEIVSTETPIGVSKMALSVAIERQGTLPDALLYLADLVDVGDGGVDSEHCIVPDLRFWAQALMEWGVAEDAFWEMMESGQ